MLQQELLKYQNKSNDKKQSSNLNWLNSGCNNTQISTDALVSNTSLASSHSNATLRKFSSSTPSTLRQSQSPSKINNGHPNHHNSSGLNFFKTKTFENIFKII